VIGGPVGKTIVAVCSPSELGESIPFTTLHFPDYTMNLAYNTDTVFTNLLKVSDHDSHTPIIVKLGVECLQMATVSIQIGYALILLKLVATTTKPVLERQGVYRRCDQASRH
jgi:hypothetical protein